ncbi:MAG TPA: NADP-dependent glyceraldehyde-3-phosphate dehydrogenase [Cryomorphaceae bacterium]|nr:NADP-dependent glyceraldehyde-3-phosphate dehydrogenase [Cryomorphaceae bacterium]HBB80250.1 NADP-dependent glyceraldehyde-3-phosphate dehydrogenase [Cryomorphaceae bacterium]HCY25464.1 NADP-dependent glyceraldehyde-3-phosphate dehydrogenase [Cryomorphaceae bacterium]|tara:strand:- start:4234 stop:5829 length:1596 start_codon:yes stop_codon:yes gene_type:complete
MKSNFNHPPIAQHEAPQPIKWDKYLINGELKTWEGPRELVYSPMGKVDKDGFVDRVFLGESPTLDESVGLEALGAAKQAYNNGRGFWPTASATQRITCMERFLKLMVLKREEVSTLLMWEIAKNKSASYKEFDRTVDYIKDTIEEYKELQRRGSHIASKGDVISQVRRGPLGVVLCLGPYNYPLNETFCLLIPSVLMGNTIVFKPAKYGVLLLTPLMEAFKEAFPPGVINVIFGRGRTLAGPIMKTGDVDVLALIGNSKSSNALAAQHPKSNRLRQVLGLEAKNPAIVFEDANLDKAIKQCVAGALSFNGQRCTALKIIFVHKSISAEFVTRFSDAVDKLKLDHPENNSDLTPLPEANKVDYMDEYVFDAKEKGANVMNKRAGKVNETSYFPAVLFPVNKHMRIFHEEQFGPVVPIVEYDKLEEVMDAIAESDHGQQCSVFSENEATISYVVDNLVNQVCRVNINTSCQRGPDYLPFTGRKDSAVGTLSVHDALRSFSIRTVVAAGTDQKDLVRDIVSSGQSNWMTTDYLL